MFSAGFFVNEIMTGKNYDRKKNYYVSLFGSVGKRFLVLFTYLVYNTVVRLFVVVSAISELPPKQSAGK
jgi:hypothetical protein